MAQNKSSDWINKIHHASGSWSIQQFDGKQYFVLGDDFDTLPGPNLKFYLTNAKVKAIGNRESIDQTGIFLGDLKTFSGAQQYEIPQNVKLKDYQSIVIHCKRYSVVWAGINIHD